MAKVTPTASKQTTIAGTTKPAKPGKKAPLEVEFSKVQDMAALATRRTRVFTIWAAAAKEAKSKYTPELVPLAVLADTMEKGIAGMAAMLAALQKGGYAPPAKLVIPKGTSKWMVGARVEFKAGPILERQKKIVDDVAELSRLVIAKVVDDYMVVDIADKGGPKRLGSFSRLHLSLIKEG